MKKILKNEEGFTLVELMVVVAIIGILSAIAVPNFKKYQAKSKQSEAKIQLAMVYTIENTAMADYDTYATCLTYLGYDTPARGYYSVGFNAEFGLAPVVARTNSATGCVAGQRRITPGTTLLADGTAGVLLTGGNTTAPTVALPSAMATASFTAAAAGNLQTSNPARLIDIWTITQHKTLSNPTVGF